MWASVEAGRPRGYAQPVPLRDGAVAEADRRRAGGADTGHPGGSDKYEAQDRRGRGAGRQRKVMINVMERQPGKAVKPLWEGPHGAAGSRKAG